MFSPWSVLIYFNLVTLSTPSSFPFVWLLVWSYPLGWIPPSNGAFAVLQRIWPFSSSQTYSVLTLASTRSWHYVSHMCIHSWSIRLGTGYCGTIPLSSLVVFERWGFCVGVCSFYCCQLNVLYFMFDVHSFQPGIFFVCHYFPTGVLHVCHSIQGGLVTHSLHIGFLICDRCCFWLLSSSVVIRVP